MIENKYSHEQQRAAVRAAKAQRKAGGSIKDLPVWIQEANREYYGKYDSNRVRNPNSVYRPVLLEDGIIDWLAIDLVVRGQRVVNLTYPERILAVAGMLRTNLRPSEMANHLGISNKTVSRIAFQIRHNDAEQKVLNAIANEKYEVSAVA